MQLALDGGTALSIAWQVLPYALLTFGEVLVSATGLEFAYSQAPAAMKGAIMAFWSLSVTVGNLWVLLVNAGVRNDAVTQAIDAVRPGRDELPDVLLRRLRVPGRAGLRLYAARYTLADHIGGRGRGSGWATSHRPREGQSHEPVVERSEHHRSQFLTPLALEGFSPR